MPTVTHTATYEVTGLTCDHCVRAVREEVGALTGVAGPPAVHVDLVAGGTSRVTVESAGPPDEQALRAALEEAGDYVLVTAAG